MLGTTVSWGHRVVGSMLQVVCAAVASVFIRLFYLIGLFRPIYHLRKTLLQFTSEWFGCNRDREPIICSRHAFVPRSLTLFRTLKILSKLALVSLGLRLPEI